jgi:hypothetical protein
MCGIQSQEIAKGWEIFLGSSIKGHIRFAMGSNRVDLEKARENMPINLLRLHYKKGYHIVGKGFCAKGKK